MLLGLFPNPLHLLIRLELGCTQQNAELTEHEAMFTSELGSFPTAFTIDEISIRPSLQSNVTTLGQVVILCTIQSQADGKFLTTIYYARLNLSQAALGPKMSIQVLT